MKYIPFSKDKTIFLLIIVSFLYAFWYFNYFETPTRDYIGNILPVVQYFNSHHSFNVYKILPAYPVLLGLASNILPNYGRDFVYNHALITNIFLYFIYLLVVYRLFRIFLSRTHSAGAMLLLTVNIYSVYTAVNSELEMFLSLTIVTAIFLSLKNSVLSYVFAFFAASTKWDAVFIIPAVMFKNFFYKNKKIQSVILGSLSFSIVGLWLYLNMKHGSPYVKEIAERGPNIYHFLFDTVNITSSSDIWISLQAYYSKNNITAALLYILAVLFFITTTISLLLGFIFFIKKYREERFTLLTFFSGFLLIHMAYQNTKERYVLPVLWFTTLLVYLGFIFKIVPFLTRVIKNNKKKSATLVTATTIASLVISAIYITLGIREGHGIVLVFSIPFTLVAILLIKENLSMNKIIFLSTVLFCFFTINIYYGTHTMDHYSYRRVEFKKAGLWFKENYKDKDKLFISNVNIPVYYSGLSPERFQPTRDIRSNTYSELIEELKEKGVTYVFVDDFYIRRMKINDKNAFSKKAPLFKEIRDHGESLGNFKLIKTFKSPNKITSYLYKFKG